jgi:hypothetical protein
MSELQTIQEAYSEGVDAGAWLTLSRILKFWQASNGDTHELEKLLLSLETLLKPMDIE